jgi:uncharacterized membrane protein
MGIELAPLAYFFAPFAVFWIPWAVIVTAVSIYAFRVRSRPSYGMVVGAVGYLLCSVVTEVFNRLPWTMPQLVVPVVLGLFFALTFAISLSAVFRGMSRAQVSSSADSQVAASEATSRQSV